MKKLKVLIFSFLMIIYCPMILAAFYFATDVKLDVTLGGYFDTYEYPTLTADSYIRGEFQSAYEEWLNANIIPRGLCIKLYNQIEYSCFDLGNDIIGKKNNIFFYDYVADALGLDGRNYATSDKQAELRQYVDHLISIQRKLEVYDKKLFVYITPSKAVHCRQDIPLRYMVRENTDNVRAADYLRELLSETNIPYLDVETLIPNHDYPIFYTTGLHWARPLEQEMTYAIIELLEEISGKSLKNISLTSMKTSDTPYNRDADLYELLNVFSPIRDIVYYEYEVEKQYPETYEKTRILLQGGSFAEGLLYDYTDLYSNDEISYINYMNYILDCDGNQYLLNSWDDLDLGKYLNNVDFVVIELQEASIKNCSDGFVAYLDEYLDSYIPTEVVREYSSNFDAAKQSVVESSRGYSDVDNGFAWVGQCSCVTLENDRFATEGMTIELTVPEHSLADKELMLNIYVNQKKIDTVSVSTPGLLKLDYDSDIFSEDTDVYEIEIYSDSSFVPKELGLNEGDTRELSLMIHYIGEKR